MLVSILCVFDWFFTRSNKRSRYRDFGYANSVRRHHMARLPYSNTLMIFIFHPKMAWSNRLCILVR